MLTRQGWLVGIGAGALLLMGRVLGLVELFALGVVAGALLLGCALLVSAARLELEVGRTVHPARVHVGTSSRVDLTIRNLFLTRRISWRDVADMRFEGGDPWVTIELTDTDTLAVMAIQKADAGYGRAEAGRLAALVQALGPTPPSPDVTAE